MIQFSTSKQGSLSLPTFLVGMGRPSVQDGVPIQSDDAHKHHQQPDDVLHAPGNTEYHHYLVDARNAVRQRYEATKCWIYPYDGLNPPPHSAISSRGPDKDPEEANNHEDDMSTPGGPISMTDEETQDFWKLMDSSCVDSVRERLENLQEAAAAAAAAADLGEEALTLVNNQKSSAHDRYYASGDSLGGFFTYCSGCFWESVD